MYADRYARTGGINPASLGMAVGINVAVVAALLLASPTVTEIFREPPIQIVDIEDPVPPPPEPPKPQSETKTQPRTSTIETVDPLVKSRPIDEAPTFPPLPPQPPIGPVAGEGGGGAGTLPILPPAPPVLVQPGVDPRYADQFQPPYPPAEERAGRTGQVVVRVLIGVDGRVKQVERVSATSDDFFRVTQQRALAKWRFTPGTRDGIPVEAWRRMTVTFLLNGDT